MTEIEKKVIRTLNNSIARTKRVLEKAKSNFYPNAKELEFMLNDKKEKLKLYKDKIKQTNEN